MHIEAALVKLRARELTAIYLHRLMYRRVRQREPVLAPTPELPTVYRHVSHCFTSMGVPQCPIVQSQAHGFATVKQLIVLQLTVFVGVFTVEAPCMR